MERKRWHLTSYRRLGWLDRLRVLFGGRIYMRFESPNGECSAACRMAMRVQGEWPSDAERWT